MNVPLRIERDKAPDHFNIKSEKIYNIGIPLKFQIVIPPIQHLSFMTPGFELYANLNNKNSYYGSIDLFRFGKLN